MSRTLDHVVIWADDPLRSLEFFETVVGLPGVRVDEYRAGEVLFPSVRISDDTLIDIMPRAAAPKVDAMTLGPGAAGSAGHPVNHVCIAMSEREFDALRARLGEHGTPPTVFMQQAFGARGLAPQSFYFRDPDGNVFEARHYGA